MMKNNTVATLGTQRYGWQTVPVFGWLWGEPYNEVARGFIHSLRPSSVRLARSSITCDSQIWRVTVWLDENDLIKRIEQEVEVELPLGIENGHELEQAFLNQGSRAGHGRDSNPCLAGIVTSAACH